MFRYGGGDQSAVGYSGKSTASSRVGNSCGGKSNFFFFCNSHVGRAKKKFPTNHASSGCMVICALQTGLSRFTFGSKLELEVSNIDIEDGSDGDYLDSKLRSRWIFL